VDTAIAVKEVHKRYRAVHALKGLDLSIGRGEFFGLLGPNGAGKSTLINIIAGLTRADAGQVTVLGHDVVADYRQARLHLGVVPQELVFDPFFTVRELLRIQSGYYGLGRENDPWIDELLDALQLMPQADSNMRALSGGMKRRVLIAQALVHKPEVVVLDEPTAGVDVELRQSLWVFVKRLHREGHTIVLTTHYLEEAETLCERIAIINHGALVALDDKDALLRKVSGARCKVTVSLAKPLTAVPAQLADKVLSQQGEKIELQIDKGHDSIMGVLDSLRAAGATVADLKTEQADLEDVFVELMRREKIPTSNSLPSRGTEVPEGEGGSERNG
jgi:ABC-2 type transport system ATP-binding protein